MRDFIAALPREGRWLLATVAIQLLGRGMTLPFTIIYLHEVRGFDLGVAGSLMGLIAIVGLIVTGPGGSLIDRYGARPVILGGLVCAIAGDVMLAFATTPVLAGAALCLLGIQAGVSWPAANALVATVVEGDLRQRYYGVNFALINLGIGVGGVIGGLFVDVARPETFTFAFLANAVTFTAPALVLLGPLRHVHGRAARPAADEPHAGASYASILRRPEVVWLVVIGVLLSTLGYGQIESGFPAYARQISEVSTRVVGFAFVANTAVIVLAQFWVMNRVSGRRRTRVLIATAVIWAVAWVVFGATGLMPGSIAAVVGVVAFQGLFFALGETLMQTAFPSLTNDMAPDHLRGRYNAINSASFQTGAIIGPVMAGFLLEHGRSTLFIAAMVVGCVGIAAGALRLERRITPAVNGLRTPLTQEPARQ
ncbi:putative MFS family arabinose efflux permease [Nocardioides albertanoniae]|uniref:Putative MFS family arabinose efflux permease n=2 Tax=Nocardioides albertanoniae TaxID=1175486 RepID=A0A543ABV8_9ACTN|nr:putative MFS family arabinose efflux permease [Nocardioides albertanoniae]